MSEIRYQVSYIKVDMGCDDCGDGYMRPVGTILKEYPHKIVHECDNCGATAVYDVRYPYKTERHYERIQ